MGIELYDAIIVGARCAGAPTAMLLARAGHRVLLVDRATFPSDTMSTHFLQAPAIARLNEWSLLDQLIATGCPPITRGSLTIEGNVMEAAFESSDLVPMQLAPRRTILDKLLIDAAREAGVEVREGFYLESLLDEDGVVTGVSGRTSDQENVTETAKVVVGADGRHSRVADLAGAAFAEFHDSQGCGYYGYWKGEFPGGAHFRIFSDRCTISFPTHDAHVIIAIWPIERFGEIKKHPVDHLLDACRDTPDFADALANASLTEKVIGSADIPTFVRKSSGPAWALVGDAAYHKDPTPADGINDAFKGADILASQLDEAFREKKSVLEALENYDRERSVSTDRSLASTLTVSSFGLSPAERANGFMDLQIWHMEEMQSLHSGSR